MTKPDEGYIYQMAAMIRLDPELGIKTAAKAVLSRAGYRDKARETAVERLRRKYRRLRDSQQLPLRPPVPPRLKKSIARLAAERPLQEARIRQRHADLRQQLLALGVEVAADHDSLRSQLTRLEDDLDRLQLALDGEVQHTAYSLLEEHGSEEAAQVAAEQMAERRAHLEIVVPLLRELRHLSAAR